MILALCGPASGQRQLHDAKAALAMLEELVVENELLDGAPGCDRYVRGEYASNREGRLEAELIAELGGVYSPYTDEWFAQPTETDIEHIVAAGEARSDERAAPEKGPTKRYETCEALYKDYPCGLRSFHERRLPRLYGMNEHLRTRGAICDRPAVRSPSP